MTLQLGTKRKSGKWYCPECKVLNPEENLYCKNASRSTDTESGCNVVHPDYWELTKDWPVRKKRPRFYIT